MDTNTNAPSAVADLVTLIDQLLAGNGDLSALAHVWLATRPMLTTHASAHADLKTFVDEIHSLGFAASDEEEEEDVSGGDLVDLVGGWLSDLRRIAELTPLGTKPDVLATVVVGVEGGLLTGATSDVPGIRVIGIDYDVSTGGDDDDVVAVPQMLGQQDATGRVGVYDTGLEPEWVQAIVAIAR